MKDGFIRINDNNDIFYDSIEKVCRYRMHCSECEKLIPTCRCYHDLDCLLIDIEEGIADYTCSAKCCLVGGDWDELGEAGDRVVTGDFNTPTLSLSHVQLGGSP